MQSKSEQLNKIVRELLLSDPNTLNCTMAEEATRRLGRQVHRSEISKARNRIGLGMSQQAVNSTPASLKRLALLMTVNCVRNTVIEEYHSSGKISDPEMKAFNKEVANRIYTVLLALLDPEFGDDQVELFAWLERNYPHNWDEPTLDSGLGTAMLRNQAKRMESGA